MQKPSSCVCSSIDVWCSLRKSKNENPGEEQLQVSFKKRLDKGPSFINITMYFIYTKATIISMLNKLEQQQQQGPKFKYSC